MMFLLFSQPLSSSQLVFSDGQRFSLEILD
jgi:hypothetical protein